MAKRITNKNLWRVVTVINSMTGNQYNRIEAFIAGLEAQAERIKHLQHALRLDNSE